MTSTFAPRMVLAAISTSLLETYNNISASEFDLVTTTNNVRQYEAEENGNNNAYYDSDDTLMNMNETLNCSLCLNELCLAEADYAFYKSWVSVDTYEMILISLNIIVFLAGIIGNSLVFIAVTTTKSMQSVTNIFIVNLALADILVMLFCAPPSIIWDVTNTWVFGSLMCRIVIYIQDVSVSVSVLTLTFIAYDRYHAICRPLQFASKRTKAFVVICAIWSISAMIGIPDAVTLQLDSPFKDAPCRSEDVLFDLSSCMPSWSAEFDFFFTLLKAFLLYTLPLIFMSVAYYHIVKTLWRRSDLHAGGGGGQDHIQLQHTSSNEDNQTPQQRQHINNSSSPTTMTILSRSRTISRHGTSIYRNNSTASNSIVSSSRSNTGLDNQLRTRRKVAKMLIAVVIMFSINFFPVHLLPIVNFVVDKTLTRDSPAHEKISQVLMYAGIITHCMCYFNSAINPIIYYFMSAQFKAQYRRILSCRCLAYTPSPKNNRNLLEASNCPKDKANMAGKSIKGQQQQQGGGKGPSQMRHNRSRSCLVPQSRKNEDRPDFNSTISGSRWGKLNWSNSKRISKQPQLQIQKVEEEQQHKNGSVASCNELRVPLNGEQKVTHSEKN